MTDLCYPLGPTGWHQNSRAASSADTATPAPDSRQHSLSCLPLGAESASGCQLYPGAAGWPDRTGSRPGWSESLCIGQTPVKNNFQIDCSMKFFDKLCTYIVFKGKKAISRKMTMVDDKHVATCFLCLGGPIALSFCSLSISFVKSMLFNWSVTSQPFTS